MFLIVLLLCKHSGVYVCAQCGNELFSSRTKFKHFSPWPSFTETVHEDSVVKREEESRASLTYKVCDLEIFVYVTVHLFFKTLGVIG